jgi:hypothetical protein
MFGKQFDKNGSNAKQRIQKRRSEFEERTIASESRRKNNGTRLTKKMK